MIDKETLASEVMYSTDAELMYWTAVCPPPKRTKRSQSYDTMHRWGMLAYVCVWSQHMGEKEGITLANRMRCASVYVCLHVGVSMYVK